MSKLTDIFEFHVKGLFNVICFIFSIWTFLTVLALFTELIHPMLTNMIGVTSRLVLIFVFLMSSIIFFIYYIPKAEKNFFNYVEQLSNKQANIILFCSLCLILLAVIAFQLLRTNINLEVLLSGELL